MNDIREEGPQTTGPARAQSPLARWAGQVPAILAFTLLGGLAYWGHSTGWKVPKVSDLRSATAEPDDWCPEHGVPESMCVECQPELLVRQKNYGWCKVHGVPECPEHHPDLAEVVGKRNLPQYDTAAALRLDGTQIARVGRHHFRLQYRFRHNSQRSRRRSQRKSQAGLNSLMASVASARRAGSMSPSSMPARRPRHLGST